MNSNKINYSLIISFFCILDQLSKNYVNYNLNKLLNKDLLIFTIDFVRNRGAAFNLFNNSRIFLSFISVISSILLSYFIFLNDNKLINRYGLSFILAGSLGNGIDRIMNGYVLDFIKIKLIDFPVFNIADIVINIGVLILIIDYLRDKR